MDSPEAGSSTFIVVGDSSETSAVGFPVVAVEDKASMTAIYPSTLTTTRWSTTVQYQRPSFDSLTTSASTVQFLHSSHSDTSSIGSVTLPSKTAQNESSLLVSALVDQEHNSSRSGIPSVMSKFVIIPLIDSIRCPSPPLADCLSTLKLNLASPASAELLSTIRNLQESLKNADDDGRRDLVSQFVSSDGQLIAHLLASIEKCFDPLFVSAVCEFLHDCLSPFTTGDVREALVSALIRHNAAEILFRSLKGLSSEASSRDSALTCGFQVIAKLASKDSKFPIKCRLLGGVKFIHQLIQNNFKNSTLLQPILLVLKCIAKNATNQIILGKEGCVSSLIALLTSVPKTHWTKIRLILQVVSLLCKTKANVLRLVRENGLYRLLFILDNWEKIEKRQRVKVLKALLSVLHSICDSKNGQKAVASVGGIEIIHRFIISCPLEPKCSFLLANAMNVFLKCSSKGELPVTSLRGAITFQVPTGGSHHQLYDSADSREATPDQSEDNKYSDEEDVAGDEDVSHKEVQEIDLPTEYNPETTRLEDLLRMDIFYPELFTKHHQMQENDRRNSGTFCEKVDFLTANSERELYLNYSRSVKSLIYFVKVAYPDLINAEGIDDMEPLHQMNPQVYKDKVLRTIDRVFNSGHYREKVVYDLDFLMKTENFGQIHDFRPLSNWDEKRVGKKDPTANHLNFESRFESGNLRRAIQIAPYEYDLLLNPDVNSWHHHQWFYFEVTNMEAGIPYIFNIINNEKPNSEFNYGMRPVILSVKEALLGRGHWIRTGYHICYHKNHYTSQPQPKDKFRKCPNKCYYTVSITIDFPHSYDIVYLAYHYPYTYTKLKTLLASLQNECRSSDIFFLNQNLCQTLNGNSVPLLTITNTTRKSQEKEVIFVTARVHPGESNSSWVMEGLLKFLLGHSKESQALRDRYVFKAIPMLNPEGVIHGNQRCGLTNEDLNRRWRSPSPTYHPTIYNTKALIEYVTAIVGKRPSVFCDFHGHSRQKNVFMYGCSRQQSWWPMDKGTPDEEDIMVLPRIAQRHVPTFSVRDCRYHVERAKESTARVAVWRQFKVVHSFTMEVSVSGCDSGSYKNYHMSPKLLLETGEGFCKALWHFSLVKSSSCDTNSFGNSSSTWIQRTGLNEDPKRNESDSETDLDLDLYGMSAKTG